MTKFKTFLSFSKLNKQKSVSFKIIHKSIVESFETFKIVLVLCFRVKLNRNFATNYIIQKFSFKISPQKWRKREMQISKPTPPLRNVSNRMKWQKSLGRKLPDIWNQILPDWPKNTRNSNNTIFKVKI